MSKTLQKLPTLRITACKIRNALNYIVEHCRVGIHQLFIRCSGWLTMATPSLEITVEHRLARER